MSRASEAALIRRLIQAGDIPTAVETATTHEATRGKYPPSGLALMLHAARCAAERVEHGETWRNALGMEFVSFPWLNRLITAIERKGE